MKGRGLVGGVNLRSRLEGCGRGYVRRRGQGWDSVTSGRSTEGRGRAEGRLGIGAKT